MLVSSDDVHGGDIRENLHPVPALTYFARLQTLSDTVTRDLYNTNIYFSCPYVRRAAPVQITAPPPSPGYSSIRRDGRRLRT